MMPLTGLGLAFLCRFSPVLRGGGSGRKDTVTLIPFLSLKMLVNPQISSHVAVRFGGKITIKRS